jgi:hypothetical protein
MRVAKYYLLIKLADMWPIVEEDTEVHIWEHGEHVHI